MGVAELRADNEAPAGGVAQLRAENERPPLTTAQKIVRGSAGSIIGGAIGGGLGAAAGVLLPPAAPALAVGGAMLGSAAGEAVTQYLDPLKSGVEEPSNLQIALAGLLPAAPAIARRFFLSLPGAAAGLQDFMLRHLGSKGERVIAQFAPVAGTADDLFRQARAGGAALQIPMSSTVRAAQDIADEVAKSKFAVGGAKALARRAQDFAGQGAVSFDDFRINQSDVGAMIRALEKKGGPALGRAKKLYAAMWDDMDDALAVAAASGDDTGVTLAKAIDAFKKEEAAKFLKRWWTNSVVRRVGQQNLDADAFLTKVDRGREVLAKLIPDDEIDDLIKTINAPVVPGGPTATKIPTMAKTPQLGFETMPFAQRAIVGGALGAVGGAVAGIGAGGGAGVGVLAVEALSTALTTGPGRALVRTLAERGMAWNQIGNVLLQGGRSAFSPDAEARLNMRSGGVVGVPE